MKSNYDLNLLRALDALLAAGSVTGAAERLHLSVPATSHTLARLREAMGDALFVRAGRRLVPTPRALALKAPVARLLEEANALAAAPGERDLALVQRAFTIRAPDGVAVAYGAALAEALLQAMPRATLHFVPEAHGDRGALREGRIDLDVGGLRALDREVETSELSRQRHVGAVRKGHPLARGRRSARRYAEAAHVAVAPRPGEAAAADVALAALGLARRVVLTVPNAYSALVAAARSSLVATATERIARAMAPGLGLVVFELPFEAVSEPLLMAWHPRHAQDAAHAWLRAQLARLVAGGTPLRAALPSLPAVQSPRR